MLNKRKLLFIFYLFTFATVIVIYSSSFKGYFFQDDWYSLSISKISGSYGILDFFVPNKQVVYYRPLGMQLPFYLNTLFFGLNPLPLKIFTLIVHFINTVLIYLIFKRLFKSNIPAILSSFLYATSGIHYIPFFWSSTLAFVLGPLFALFSFYFIMKKNYSRSLLLYIFGLLTFEVTVILPVIFLAYSKLIKKDKGISHT